MTFALLKVENCSNKLKRPNDNTALFPNERSVQLFSRIINIFTPTEGSVIDPFGGPLCTSLACLQTRRTCISMNAPSDEMRYAVGRLRVFATPNATMEHLEEYTDPSFDAPAIESQAIESQTSKRRRTDGVNSTARTADVNCGSSHANLSSINEPSTTPQCTTTEVQLNSITNSAINSPQVNSIACSTIDISDQSSPPVRTRSYTTRSQAVPTSTESDSTPRDIDGAEALLSFHQNNGEDEDMQPTAPLP